MIDRVEQQFGNYHHSLPAQLTPLIGRRQEVAEVWALLQRPEVRLGSMSLLTVPISSRLLLLAIPTWLFPPSPRCSGSKKPESDHYLTF